MPQGQYPLFPQELISEHFGEDGTSYETEIQELEDLRQVGGLLPIWLLQRQTEEEGGREGWVPVWRFTWIPYMVGGNPGDSQCLWKDLGLTADSVLACALLLLEGAVHGPSSGPYLASWTRLPSKSPGCQVLLGDDAQGLPRVASQW